MDYSIFRQNLRDLIEGRGTTMWALSSEINITAATLSRYLSDDAKIPNADYIVKIAQFFGVSVDWLLGLSEDNLSKLPADIQSLVQQYSVATMDDKKVIWAILDKYKKEVIGDDGEPK